MIAYAQEHRVPKQNIRFVNAFAHETGLAPECADLVTCSQSFHWMEPEETLQEVNRILKPGGIFATYDCDWPPVCDRRQRKLITTCNAGFRSLRALPRIMQIAFYVGRKASIYPRIQESGFFGYTREIVFSNTEECDARRFINLALSQGSLQTMLRMEPEIVKLCVSRLRKSA